MKTSEKIAMHQREGYKIIKETEKEYKLRKKQSIVKHIILAVLTGWWSFFLFNAIYFTASVFNTKTVKKEQEKRE